MAVSSRDYENADQARSYIGEKQFLLFISIPGDKTGDNVFQLKDYIEKHLPEYDARVADDFSDSGALENWAITPTFDLHGSSRTRSANNCIC